MTIRLPRRLPKLAALAAMAVALPLTGAATSQAAYTDFRCELASGTMCTRSPQAVRSVSAYTSTGRIVGAGAASSSSADAVLYGLGWGEEYTCSYYNGSRMLYPAVANGSSSWLTVLGTFEYGTGVQGC
jgi:hypothetical protein